MASIYRIPNRVRELLERKQFQEVVTEIDRLDLTSPTLRAGAYVLRTQAMFALGEYDSSYIDFALEQLKLTGRPEVLAQAKFLKARLLIVAANLIDASETLVEAYVHFKRVDDYYGMGLTANQQ
ncbi:MAG TPA: hypothetical protein VMS71_00475 [Candidatus Acidoferrum sp.]|nr:hypothetical protein [Candidatus Acidoferrum sp.]